MKKRLTNVILTILTLVLLVGFAVSVSSGRVTDEADEAYRDAIDAMQDEAY